MGLELAKAFVTLRADSSRLRSDLGGLQGKIRGLMGGITKSLLGPLAALGAGAAGGLMFKRMFEGGEDFNNKMRQSLAIMGDVTDFQKNEMKEAAFDVASSTMFSASQAAESYFFLASAGLSAEQQIAALPQVAAFAQAGMFDMALATDLATDAQSALGLTVKDPVKNLENLTRVTDVLTKGNILANASIQQFSEAITNEAGASLKTFNKDVEEGVAVLAAYADQGVKGQVAGSTLARVTKLLSASAIDSAEAHERFGLKVFDTNGKMNSYSNIIGQLERILGPMSDETRTATLAQLGFKARVQGAILPLIGQSKAIEEYEKKLRSAGGATADVASRQMSPLQKAMNQFQADTARSAAALSEKLNPILAKIVLAVNAARNAFSSWISKMASGIAESDFMKMIIEKFQLFMVKAKEVFARVQAFSLGFVANFSENMSILWAWIKTALSTLSEDFWTVFNFVKENWQQIVKDLVNLWITYVKNLISNVWIGIETVIRLWSVWQGWMTALWERVWGSGLLGKLWEGLKVAGMAFFNWGKEVVLMLAKIMDPKFWWDLAAGNVDFEKMQVAFGQALNTMAGDAKAGAEDLNPFDEMGRIMKQQAGKLKMPLEGFESSLKKDFPDLAIRSLESPKFKMGVAKAMGEVVEDGAEEAGKKGVDAATAAENTAGALTAIAEMGGEPAAGPATRASFAALGAGMQDQIMALKAKDPILAVNKKQLDKLGELVDLVSSQVLGIPIAVAGP